MAFNIVTTCVTDDPKVTPQDVRRLKLSLDRNRALESDGYLIAKFWIVTDYPQEEFDALGLKQEGPVKFIRFMRESDDDVLKHPSFYQRYLFRNNYFGENDKTMFIDANVVCRELVQSILYSTLPDRGNAEETNLTLTQEETDRINNDNASTIGFVSDWGETEGTEFLPYFYQFNYGQYPNLVNLMFNEETVAKYNTFIEFLAGEHDGVNLALDPAILGKYYVGGDSNPMNQQLIDNYEKNVRPFFPDRWRGIGDEPVARYIHFDHEYRTITKQTSFLYIDRGDENVDPFTDRYLELWVL